MKHSTNVIITALLLILILYCFQKYINSDRLIENFIVLVEDKIIPKVCPDKLFFDGSKYHLFNSREPITLGKNPKQFEHLMEYQDYQKNLSSFNVVSDLSSQYKKCPTLSVTTNTRVVKKKTDPHETYKKICNNRISKNLYEIEKCIAYATTQEEINKCIGQSELDQCIKNSKTPKEASKCFTSDFVDTDLESCMDALIKDTHLEFKGEGSVEYPIIS